MITAYVLEEIDGGIILASVSKRQVEQLMYALILARISDSIREIIVDNQVDLSLDLKSELENVKKALDNWEYAYSIRTMEIDNSVKE